MMLYYYIDKWRRYWQILAGGRSDLSQSSVGRYCLIPRSTSYHIIISGDRYPGGDLIIIWYTPRVGGKLSSGRRPCTCGKTDGEYRTYIPEPTTPPSNTCITIIYWSTTATAAVVSSQYCISDSSISSSSSSSNIRNNLDRSQVTIYVRYIIFVIF